VPVVAIKNKKLRRKIFFAHEFGGNISRALVDYSLLFYSPSLPNTLESSLYMCRPNSLVLNYLPASQHDFRVAVNSKRAIWLVETTIEVYEIYMFVLEYF
jgi:hypothetical protein